MPVPVADLKPGDRVVLNCPKSRVMQKREAQFEGIFSSIEDALARGDAMLMGTSTMGFLSGRAWARFLFGRATDGSGIDVDAVGAFVVEPDGGLREEHGMRIFIERRMRMGQG
jgi:hypothetical protein